MFHKIVKLKERAEPKHAAPEACLLLNATRHQVTS